MAADMTQICILVDELREISKSLPIPVAYQEGLDQSSRQLLFLIERGPGTEGAYKLKDILVLDFSAARNHRSCKRMATYSHITRELSRKTSSFGNSTFLKDMMQTVTSLFQEMIKPTSVQVQAQVCFANICLF